MVINQKNLNSLFVGYSAMFNKAFSETPVNYPKIAMTIPSETNETTYAWMGQIPNMREWIGSREIQNLMVHDYVVKNRTFELTLKIPVNDIADEQYGVYAPLVSEMGLSAKKHPDSLTFDLLRDGFKRKCYDGVSFFSDSHPMGGLHSLLSLTFVTSASSSFTNTSSLLFPATYPRNAFNSGLTFPFVPDAFRNIFVVPSFRCNPSSSWHIFSNV